MADVIDASRLCHYVNLETWIPSICIDQPMTNICVGLKTSFNFAMVGEEAMHSESRHTFSGLNKGGTKRRDKTQAREVAG